MATRIDAYKGSDGMIYETRQQAEAAELRAAVEHISNAEKTHLMNVASGHSMCRMTREAFQLIAQRLPTEVCGTDT